jgi:hypothetical protein
VSEPKYVVPVEDPNHSIVRSKLASRMGTRWAISDLDRGFEGNVGAKDSKLSLYTCGDLLWL